MVEYIEDREFSDVPWVEYESIVEETWDFVAPYTDERRPLKIEELHISGTRSEAKRMCLTKQKNTTITDGLY